MFFKENNDTDLGETTIPNIFIDIYMPMANGLYVKVYLLAYRYACELNQIHKIDNNYIAKELGIPLSDVNDAWKFWESKKIVRIYREKGDSFNYPVEFVDLKKIYMENIFISSKSNKYNIDNIVLSSEEEDFVNMFKKIERIINRYLNSNEKIELINIKNSGISSEIIVYGYEYVKKKYNEVKSVSYIKTIIDSWNEMKLKTVEDIENHLSKDDERNKLYKKIFNYLGFYRNPTKSEKDTIDTWIDKFGYDLDIILYACSKSKNTSRISISYIEAVIEKWYKASLRTIEEIKSYEENHSKKSFSPNKQTQTKDLKPKTRHHIINQTFSKYDPDELERMLFESQKNKFK